jgi:TrmH family RNA methyltransferase
MITSVHNPKIQTVRKLQSLVKARLEGQSFVIEGVRLAEEALQTGWEARQVLFTAYLDQRGKEVLNGFSTRGVPVEQVSDTVMKAISETEAPQGVLVVLALRSLPIPSSVDFILILDGVRDPGNLGTILRTAAAAGVQAVLLPPGSTDAFAPKVVRAGMGAHFYLPIRHSSWDEIKRILKESGANLRVYLADSDAGSEHTQVDFRSPLALIIGGEAAGAGTEAISLADERVRIPMPGGAESLNAAIAAGILLFEVVRQRGL